MTTMARSRGVTRQHIQTIVNDLQLQRLVEPSTNPAYKRSPVFVLTGEGRALIESIASTERDLVEPLRGPIDADRLSAAAATLA